MAVTRRSGWVLPTLSLLLALACAKGNGEWDGGDSGVSPAGGSGGGSHADGSIGGSGGGSHADGSIGGGVGGEPDAGSTGNPDSPAACVPESIVLAVVGPNGGSACGFAFDKPYTLGAINLVLTPGWGTVCYAGSSQNCGSGASADGWWFAGGEIALCDATCSRFYKQTIAGKLTVKLGCPTETCAH